MSTEWNPFVTVRTPKLSRLAELVMSEGLVFRGTKSAVLPAALKKRLEAIEVLRQQLLGIEAANRFDPQKAAEVQKHLFECVKLWRAFEGYLKGLMGLGDTEDELMAASLHNGLFGPDRRFFRLKAWEHWLQTKLRLNRLAEGWAPWVSGLEVGFMVDKIAGAHQRLGVALDIEGPGVVSDTVDVSALYRAHAQEVRRFILEVTAWSITFPEHQETARDLLEPVYRAAEIAQSRRKKSPPSDKAKPKTKAPSRAHTRVAAARAFGDLTNEPV